MAPKKGKKGFRDDARDLLSELGVKGNLIDLVRKAIIGGWSMDEFASHLVQTKVFRNKYPGLIDFQTGQIKTDFSNGMGFSAQVLQQASAAYNKGYDDFQAMSRRIGIRAPNKRMFAAAVTNDISLEEFGVRAQAIATVKSNPSLLDSFNEQLKLAGMKPLDKQGLYGFVAKTAAPKFYDTYQAAFLRQAGFSQEDATTAAKGMDSNLSPNLDLGKLVSEINRVKADIAPELRAQGITDADLVLLAAGSDPRGIAGKLEQITAQRRGNRGGPGTYAQQSSTGGLSIYPEDEAGY